MEIVYYVRPGDKNEELRYSLRSLANIDHDKVWMVGHKPAWVTNVEYIPGNRQSGPQANAIDNLWLACEYLRGERFVVFNDDFYVMDPVLAIPTYHKGLLADRGTLPAELSRARTRLAEMGHVDPIDWTIHIPVVVWRRKLADIIKMIVGRFVPEWRTMYGNLADVAGEQAPDVKVRRRSDPIPDGPFLSSSDATFPRLRSLLQERFPMPSPYEMAT